MGRAVTMPDSHVLVSAGRVRAAIRRDLVASLGPWILAPALTPPADAQPVGRGRGAAYRATIGGGIRAVVRPYRRGGWIARFATERYLGVRPRPLRELAVVAEARRRGVPVPEVLAARVDGRGVYRGALVSAEVAGTTTLIDALATADLDGRVQLGGSAGRLVAVMHRAGVRHADLNLTNILCRADAPSAVAIVDLDRARLAAGPLARRWRERSLRRLLRSAEKLDPGRRMTGGATVAAFRAGYAAVLEVPCGC